MGMKNEFRGKVGARSLSKEEVKLILPTYEVIYDQIQNFREEKEFYGQDILQKTNNIGIIGVRGAGKTSVLKTVKDVLDKKNEKRESKDIILPIIIPENMSESSTLMATILGMLGEIVKYRDNNEKRDPIDCIKKGKLQETYNEVVKQYTFIQKEYRDILIHEYTTENDYLKSSTKVFNSDTEFIKKFNEFIDVLVKAEQKKDTLLFLFIDDIDLSTHRCSDVVKTLLSYLSNENIVTIISGDLETFEEALILDFLRQEKIVLDNNMLNDYSKEDSGKKTILESKRQLAYEYLKKILPPIYRHIIKHWSLEEKGKYLVSAQSGDFQKREENNSGVKALIVNKTLSDLLSVALKDWIDQSFFNYTEKQNNEDKENDNQTLPYTFHLFDNASRGLNNIYNLLNQLAEKRSQNEEKVDYLREKKQLLDTIIASKPTYNQHRDEIQKNIIIVGLTKEDCKVFFDNAFAIIYKEKKSEAGTNKSQDKKSIAKKNYYIEDPVERFSLFILVDFAARLLYEKNFAFMTKDDINYKSLKKNAMEDLFFNSVIAEKVIDVPRYSVLDTKKESPENLTLYDVNFNFLTEGELVLNLAYYKNISLKSVIALYDVEGKDVDVNWDFSDVDLRQHSIIAFWKAVSSVARVNGIEPLDKIVEYYPVFYKEFAYIQRQVSSSITQNVIMRLFDVRCEKVIKEVAGRESLEVQNKKRVLLNTIAQLLKTSEKDEVNKEWQHINFEEIVVANGMLINDSEKDKLIKRVTILQVIDSKQLWKKEVVKDVIKYLNREIHRYLSNVAKKIFNNDDSDTYNLDTTYSVVAWEEFVKSKDGVSATIAKKTKSDIRSILNEIKSNFNDGIPYDSYKEVCRRVSSLAGNHYVWYGQNEAQKLLNSLRKSWGIIKNGNNDAYFIFLLQCYLRYKLSLDSIDDINQKSFLLADIVNTLSDAQEKADEKALDEFIENINEELTEKIDSDDFDKLFSI